MSISRRDFLNGVAISIVAGVAPIKILNASPKQQLQTLVYPPKLTGLRGSHPGSFEPAHALARDGKHFNFEIPPHEEYDLVIVGAGISGLSAACFYQQLLGKGKKILLLDNHDDFGGHATRNEFTTPDGSMIMSYGGSESLQSPRSLYSEVATNFMKTIGVDIDELEKTFDTTFYPDLGLGRGVYFDEKNFGVNKVVSGDPGRNIPDDIPPDRINGRPLDKFIGDFPLPPDDRTALLFLHEGKTDYLKGMTVEKKEEWMAEHSYSTFLREKVGLSDKAVKYFQKRTNEFMGIGIDAVPCADARICSLPGFEAMNLPPLDHHAKAYEEPYIFHFPDGNASLARLMVRQLIPGVAEGSTMHDVVMAAFNYERLDNPDNNVRLRLSSTVLHAKNLTENDKKFVDVVYINNDKLQCVRAKQVIMAGYNMMVPYIVPEMPEKQKKSLKKNVKAPLVYAKLIIKNWQPFMKLGVHEIYSPAAPYSRVKLDYPVDIGGYKHPRSPDKPICLHMVYTPTLSGSGLSQREQWSKGRAQILGMAFEQYEDLLREQLHGMLGSAGFKHQEDILAITINRWPHGYSYIANTLFDDEDEAEKIQETARQPIGNITIANSDSHWEPYAHGAIDMAWRAVNELVAMNNERAAS